MGPELELKLHLAHGPSRTGFQSKTHTSSWLLKPGSEGAALRPGGSLSSQSQGKNPSRCSGRCSSRKGAPGAGGGCGAGAAAALWGECAGFCPRAALGSLLAGLGHLCLRFPVGNAGAQPHEGGVGTEQLLLGPQSPGAATAVAGRGDNELRTALASGRGAGASTASVPPPGP